MSAAEVLSIVQAVRVILDFALINFRLLEQAGRFTDEQKAAILAAAGITDDQVDAVIDAARRRRGLVE